jgi:hypothetical protein
MFDLGGFSRGYRIGTLGESPKIHTLVVFPYPRKPFVNHIAPANPGGSGCVILKHTSICTIFSDSSHADIAAPIIKPVMIGMICPHLWCESQNDSMY